MVEKGWVGHLVWFRELNCYFGGQVSNLRKIKFLE